MGHSCVFVLPSTLVCSFTLNLPLLKEWLADKGPLESPEFREAVKALDVEGKPDSYYLPFAHDSLPRAALTAPLCELVRPPMV